MRAAAFALVLAIVAGCAGPGAPTPAATPTPEPDTMTVSGSVQGPGLQPVTDALVTIGRLGLAARTGGDGGFRFEALPRALHVLDVAADGFLPASATVDPATAATPLVVVLEPHPDTLPFNETQHFAGLLQCASETLIVSGSCDAAVTFAGQDPVLDQNASWDFAVRPGWSTLVLDVVFDGSGHPGLDGLRIVVRALGDGASLGEYGQYGRFNASSSFTARVEPGGTYPDGEAPLPANATVFRLDVYPHSHGWHAVCAPPDGTCFLGAGAAVDVAFDLYATAFYNGAAPDGWTLRNA